MRTIFQALSILFLLFVATANQAQNFNIELRSTLSFPGQTLANICGYTQNGREYALIGGSKGLIIVEVTNPDNPVTIVQIPGPDNLWKEIKTYSHYAYVTSEGGGGVQIVDLSNLPSAALDYHSYKGDGSILNALNTIHALHIDVTRGFLYVYGSNLFSSGATVLDLNTDPYNPTFVGHFDNLGYVHDGFAENDTLYAAHIESGFMSIVDMTDKSSPQILGQVETPASFTHNTWLLSDHKYILTTDEKVPSFLTAYDISDPTNIFELDRFSTNDGFGSIGHNTHVRNDWAITSWYTDGVSIVDAHRPQNLVQVGYYDTWNGTGANFDGCWGVYPFFPSGTIVASNIDPAQLFVLTPTYQRACYLEGIVKNASNSTPLINVQMTVTNGDPGINTLTAANGTFKTGQVTEGTFDITFSKFGFESQTVSVTLVAGEVVELEILLNPLPVYNITGQVVSATDGSPIANAPVAIIHSDVSYTAQTNASGQFSINNVLSGDYTAIAGAWGYLISAPFTINSASVTIPLSPGYYDDFAFNYNWTNSFTSNTGHWTRAEPEGTELNGGFSNPELDVTTDYSDKCFTTGNGGGGAGTDDVDDGSVTLVSPVMQLGNYEDAVLSFWYWFVNGGGQGTPPNDYFEARVTNGTETVVVWSTENSQNEWLFSGDIHLKDYISLTNNMKVQFITEDVSPGHVVEAGVDVFKVVPGNLLVGTNELAQEADLRIAPNPSSSDFELVYSWKNSDNLQLEVVNTLGQIVDKQQLAPGSSMVRFGAQLPNGVYVVRLNNGKQVTNPVKVVKE